MMVKDHISEDGAQKLARRIREYWGERGMKVATSVAPVAMGTAGDNKGAVFSVRSDMVDALPRRASA